MSEFQTFYRGARVRVSSGYTGHAFDALVDISLTCRDGGGTELDSSMYRVLEVDGDSPVEMHQWVPEQLMEILDKNYEHNQDIIDKHLIF